MPYGVEFRQALRYIWGHNERPLSKTAQYMDVHQCMPNEEVCCLV